MLISGSSFRTKKVEQFGIKVTLEVLMLPISKEWKKNFYDFSTGRSLKLLGYDTLDGVNWRSTTEGNGVDTIRDQTLTLVERSQCILDRVNMALERLQLGDGQDLTGAQCDALVQAGVVVELVLLPMASIRDVARWRNESNVI